MTPGQFRRLALSSPDASEGSHMQHPDFRVGGRIFATIGYPDGRHGMIKLTPIQQADVLETDRASAFAPAAGAWGHRGATTVLLEKADAALVRIALTAARENLASMKPVRRSPKRGSSPKGPSKRKKT